MKKFFSQSMMRNITFSVVALLWLFVSPITAFFWSLFLIWAVLRLDTRIIGVGALIVLGAVPITLSLPLYEWMSEQLAVYVYYLLCITVALQILELRRSPDEDEQASPTPRDAHAVSHVQEGNSVREYIVKGRTYLASLSLHKRVIIFFSATTLLILWGMLAPGYILSLDMVWTDKMVWSLSTDGFNNSAPLYILLTLLSIILPAWVVQKIVLAGLFFSMMYVPYRFLPFLQSNMSRVFVGLLYALNPFVYTRMLAGQWMILLGYAMLPLVVYGLLQLLTHRDKRSGLVYGGILVLLGCLSIHFLYLSIVLSICWICVYGIRFLILKNYHDLKKIIVAGMYACLVFVVFSTYWIIPAYMRENPVEERFTSAHFEDFATSENHLLPTPLNLAVLGGFWGEGEEWRYYFIWPQENILFWFGALVLLSIMSIGIYTLLRDTATRFFGIQILVTTVLLYILALGAWGGMFTSFNIWLYTHFPAWAGLRDSHKIAGFIAVFYSLMAGVGVQKIITTMCAKKLTHAKVYILILCVIPFIFGMHELFGFKGQLKPTEYPTAWYEARAMIHNASSTEKMLVLPWQGYFSLSFANQLIVANPTQRFFYKNNVIDGRSVGMENLYDQEVETTYRAIDTFLHNAKNLTTEEIVSTLRYHGIRYLFVVVNTGVENQNTWLLPEEEYTQSDSDTSSTKNPEEAEIVQTLLQAPHEVLLKNNVLLYRFTY